MLHILKAKHLVFNYCFSSAFLIPLRNSDNFVVEEEIKTTDKTMETFQKKKRGGGKGKLESDLETAETTNALSKCRGRGAKKRKHVSAARVLFVHPSCMPTSNI